VILSGRAEPDLVAARVHSLWIKVREKENFGVPDVPAHNALELALRIIDSVKESIKQALEDYHVG